MRRILAVFLCTAGVFAQHAPASGARSTPKPVVTAGATSAHPAIGVRTAAVREPVPRVRRVYVGPYGYPYGGENVGEGNEPQDLAQRPAPVAVVNPGFRADTARPRVIDYSRAALPAPAPQKSTQPAAEQPK